MFVLVVRVLGLVFDRVVGFGAGFEEVAFVIGWDLEFFSDEFTTAEV